MRESLHIIKQEHRNLFRVVNMMDQILRSLKPGETPDFSFLDDVLDYIETFTDVYHHPKEDLFLFRLLRQRDAGAEAIIEELEEEHQRCPVSLKAVKDGLAAFRAQGPEGLETFRALAADYLRFQTKHLQKEEGIVLPLAMRALTEEDWAEIDTAFRDNADPVFGPQGRAETRSLYSRIVNEAPAPFGFGD
ncbi:hemerythrin domain-containing protein [Novispirillum itersonii]|uniref:hemerythrin domain-containing protein n=1 Tax=Novispirillum itersonii TaxID=189 RepID=UPI000381F2EC|nr:hemerythrin domain-containing protein [Novispirillum itersonii]